LLIVTNHYHYMICVGGRKKRGWRKMLVERDGLNIFAVWKVPVVAVTRLDTISFLTRTS